jgi:hypothetical protein
MSLCASVTKAFNTKARGFMAARGVGGRGAANIMKHLKGIHFPVDKAAIIDHAQRSPAPDTDAVVDALSQIPDGVYTSMAHILKTVSHPPSSLSPSSDTIE